MSNTVPCIFPDVCNVTYHLEIAHCEGLRRVEAQGRVNAQREILLGQQRTIEYSMGQKANLSSVGLEGDWFNTGQNESGNNLYAQVIPESTKNPDGLNSKNMASLIEIEENESDETFSVRIKSTRESNPYITPAVEAEDETLARHVKGLHATAQLYNNRVAYRDDPNSMGNKPSGMDKNWIPAPQRGGAMLEYRKSVTGDPSTNTCVVQEPKSDQEKCSVSYISLRDDGNIRVINNERAFHEQSASDDRTKNHSEESTQRYDFRHADNPLKKYSNMRGVRMSNGLEIIAPSEMRDEIEEAVRGHNDWIKNDPGPVDWI